MADCPPLPERELRKLVATMRELGVTSAFGVTLGPPPAPALTPEEESADRQVSRLERARQDMRDTLGAAGGYNMSQSEIDRLLDPSLFEDA